MASSASRAHRGFDRLGLFLAAIPALIGAAVLIFGNAVDWKTPIPHVSVVKWTFSAPPSSVAVFRQRYPHQYDNLSDDQLLDALYQKFYSDMPREQFDAEVRGHEPRLPTGHVLDELLQIEGIGYKIVPGSFDGLSLADQNKTVDEIVSTVWWNKFAVPLATLLGITLGVSLAVYLLVRAIGRWIFSQNSRRA